MILPGHRVCRLTVLDFGSFDVGPGKRRIGIPGFLIETDRGARILVDTGFDPLYARDPAAAEARDHLSDFGVLIDSSDHSAAPGQLASNWDIILWLLAIPLAAALIAMATARVTVGRFLMESH